MAEKASDNLMKIWAKGEALPPKYKSPLERMYEKYITDKRVDTDEDMEAFMDAYFSEIEGPLIYAIEFIGNGGEE